jgi:hypothetical protein
MNFMTIIITRVIVIQAAAAPPLILTTKNIDHVDWLLVMQQWWLEVIVR